MRPARSLAFDLNKSRVVPAEGKCVPELFQQQVRSAPEAVAVVFEKEQVTYRDLNTRANQLAHYLRKLGIGPEVLVGICVGRSPMMLIGLLGILKAGGAYVPLDPAYPPERLRFITEDAATPVVITQRQLLSILPPGPAHTICLDDWKVFEHQSEDDLCSETVAQNLSHVIYTSGSTGKPKGVAIQHQSVAALKLTTSLRDSSFPPASLTFSPEITNTAAAKMTTGETGKGEPPNLRFMRFRAGTIRFAKSPLLPVSPINSYPVFGELRSGLPGTKNIEGFSAGYRPHRGSNLQFAETSQVK